MVTKYPISIHVVLESIGTPTVEIGVEGSRQTLVLTGVTSFNFQIDDPRDKCQLEIWHTNKQINDSNTAVIIKEVSINGINSPKFVWLGTYTPEYPAHYIEEHRRLGKELATELTNTNYLGWNGIWRLAIGVPAFMWIHQVENLGWIYD